jgi:hypothetical protein
MSKEGIEAHIQFLNDLIAREKGSIKEIDKHIAHMGEPNTVTCTAINLFNAERIKHELKIRILEGDIMGMHQKLRIFHLDNEV